jgi:hypothetical protein
VKCTKRSLRKHSELRFWVGCSDGHLLCLDSRPDESGSRVKSASIFGRFSDGLVSRFISRIVFKRGKSVSRQPWQRFTFSGRVQTGLGRNCLSEFSAHFIPTSLLTNVFSPFSLLWFDYKP